MESLFTKIQKQLNMLKFSLLFKKFTNLRVNNSRITRIKNAKFSEYFLCINTNIQGDFQLCISVPLKPSQNSLNNTCVEFSFLIKPQMKRENPTHAFSCKFCKIFKNTCFYHGVIILNGSNNSVFLYLKMYWNGQVFDLICASEISMKSQTLRHQASSSKCKFFIWKY